MKVNNPTLEKVAFLPDQYPPGILPEIALAGRSNVGKSSFVNSMINRKNLARTSSQPGKTQTLNFYNMDDKFRLVDLPGYGYAKASQSKREEWAEAINTYLETRENLVDIFLIIDYRHSPSDLDQMMYNYIVDMGFSGTVIATKADKVKKSQRQKNLNEILKKLNIQDESKVIIYSSEDGNYKKNAWQKIDKIVENSK